MLNRYRAGLVAWLSGVRIHRGIGQHIRLLIVHGHEELASTDRGRDYEPCLGASMSGADRNEIIRVEPGGFDIIRMHFNVRVLWVEPTENARLSSARLCVPLRGGASAGNEGEREGIVGGFGIGLDLVEEELGSLVCRVESAVFE